MPLPDVDAQVQICFCIYCVNVCAFALSDFALKTENDLSVVPKVCSSDQRKVE